MIKYKLNELKFKLIELKFKLNEINLWAFRGIGGNRGSGPESASGRRVKRERKWWKRSCGCDPVRKWSEIDRRSALPSAGTASPTGFGSYCRIDPS